MRLARYTQQTSDIEPLVGAAATASAPLAPPALPERTAVSDRPGISLDATAMLQRERASSAAMNPLPKGPLALLGGLSALVVVLGIALIVV